MLFISLLYLLLTFDWWNLCWKVRCNLIYRIGCFSVATLILSLCVYLLTICLAMDLLKFILLGVHWSSWMSRLMFFIKFGRFWSLLLSAFLSLSFSDSHYTYAVPQTSEALFILFILISFCFSEWIISIYLASSLLILSSSSLNLLLSPSGDLSSFQLL